jgi:hypothetical protein
MHLVPEVVRLGILMFLSFRNSQQWNLESLWGINL